MLIVHYSLAATDMKNIKVVPKIEKSNHVESGNTVADNNNNNNHNHNFNNSDQSYTSKK